MNFTSATIDYVKLDSFIIACKDSQVGEVNIFEENLLIVKKRNTWCLVSSESRSYLDDIFVISSFEVPNLDNWAANSFPTNNFAFIQSIEEKLLFMNIFCLEDTVLLKTSSDFDYDAMFVELVYERSLIRLVCSK